MKYTYRRPKKEGYYWLRHRIGDRVYERIKLVYFDNDRNELMADGNFTLMAIPIKNYGMIDYEWAGPLKPPKG